MDHDLLVRSRSPAQVYCLVAGAALAAGGVLGFFYNASFTTGDATLTDRDAVLGLLDVNGWHNLVHLASGVFALALARSFSGARTFAGALGAAYAVVAILGLALGDGESIVGVLPINTEDNVLHVLLSAAGLAAYFASTSEPAPSTV